MSTAPTTPLSLRQMIEEEASQLFTGLKPEVAEACRREYSRGRLEVLLSQQGIRSIESVRENSASGNTSSGAGTTGDSSLPSQMNRLPDSSPLVRSVTLAEAAQALTQLGFRFGHALSEERVRAMHGVLVEAGWTAAEVGEAVGAISADPELARQVGIDRTIGPAVFAMARNHAKVQRGRLHDHAAVKQMCEDRRRPIHEFAETVHLERTADDGERYYVAMWRLK